MTNSLSVPSLDVEACVREAAEAIEGLFVPAHRSGCLWLNDHRMPCQCGSAERERAAVLRARRAAEALRHALASALPGMGKDSERWRAFTAQHSLAHHYSWDGKPNSQLIILENGFISLDDVADRLRAARAAQPEETSRKGWIGCSTRLHASGERTDRGSEP